jgi:pSer/pThr/pTyr-binding forkhead associated (FHA) protein
MFPSLIPECGYPTIRLAKTLTLVGRQEQCDVRINSSRISRCHCCLVLEGGNLSVRDLNSTNGIRVNGQPVESSPLRHGDLLMISHLSYRVSLDDSAAERAVPPRPGETLAEPPSEEHPTSLELIPPPS